MHSRCSQPPVLLNKKILLTIYQERFGNFFDVWHAIVMALFHWLLLEIVFGANLKLHTLSIWRLNWKCSQKIQICGRKLHAPNGMKNWVLLHAIWIMKKHLAGYGIPQNIYDWSDISHTVNVYVFLAVIQKCRKILENPWARLRESSMHQGAGHAT